MHNVKPLLLIHKIQRFQSLAYVPHIPVRPFLPPGDAELFHSLKDREQPFTILRKYFFSRNYDIVVIKKFLF